MKVTEEVRRQIVDLYLSGEPVRVIIGRFDVSERTIYRVLEWAGVNRRLRGGLNRHTEAATPTPEEIKEGTAEIRKGWTEAEHRRRAPHLARVEMQFPEFCICRSGRRGRKVLCPLI